MKTKDILLKKKGDFRINQGGLWIFANEIQSPLSDFEKGEIVDVYNTNKQFCGTGYINPHSLITVRLITRKKNSFNTELIRKRLDDAYKLRKFFYPEANSFRWVYSEGDYLPGLIADYYNGIVVMQILTAGMDKLFPLIAEQMTKHFNVTGIYLVNDEPMRKLELLDSFRGYWSESKEKPEFIEYEENSIKYRFSPENCQKTGHFFDQRENRLLLKNVAKNKSVLDLFSYNGSWGFNAIKAGAKEVMAVDNSATALSQIEQNAGLNGFESKIQVKKIDLMRHLDLKEDKYNIIILDPPALIKSKKYFHQGYAAYLKLNREVMKMIKIPGWLISCSCSYHLSEKDFIEMLMKAGQKAQKQLQLIELRYQAKDHPVLPGMPETRYLKCALLRVT